MLLSTAIWICGLFGSCGADEGLGDPALANFAKSELVAWCIVPFDAKQRGPAERAAMVKRLGLRRVAYDWRAQHVPTFEQEILEYQKRGIEYFAFWGWHDEMEKLIEKHSIKPQIWQTSKTIEKGSDAEKIAEAVKRLMPIVEKTRRLGLRLGLYNHGGWAGEPDSLVAICERLKREANADHIGIVYNFHHGHSHIKDFGKAVQRMKPYLLCVNLNGMHELANIDDPRDANKIAPIGEGLYEQAMINRLIECGYTGPIGIIGHRKDKDVEEVLRKNMEGLDGIIDRRVANKGGR